MTTMKRCETVYPFCLQRLEVKFMPKTNKKPVNRKTGEKKPRIKDMKVPEKDIGKVTGGTLTGGIRPTNPEP